jgi:hypothetical protein
VCHSFTVETLRRQIIGLSRRYTSLVEVFRGRTVCGLI